MRPERAPRHRSGTASARSRAPSLVLVGEHDAKFTELGRRLVDGIPAPSSIVDPDAGHSVHLEQPDATADAIANWLDGTTRR